MRLECQREYVTVGIRQLTACQSDRIVTGVPAAGNAQAELVSQEILDVKAHHRIGVRYILECSLLKE